MVFLPTASMTKTAASASMCGRQVPSILDLAQAAGRSVRAAASDPDILLTVNAETAAWAWPDRAAVLALAEELHGLPAR